MNAAQVQRRRPDAQQVGLDAAQLAGDRADRLAARRELDAQQLLARPCARRCRWRSGGVVHPVDDGDVLVVVEVLAEFLEAAVQVADVRRAADDAFAVEFQHQAQRGVRGRVLRAEIERPAVLSYASIVLRWSLGCTMSYETASSRSPNERECSAAPRTRSESVSCQAGHWRRKQRQLCVLRNLCDSIINSAQAVSRVTTSKSSRSPLPRTGSFSQRIILEILWHQDPPQVRVAGEISRRTCRRPRVRAIRRPSRCR